MRMKMSFMVLQILSFDLIKVLEKVMEVILKEFLRTMCMSSGRNI